MLADGLLVRRAQVGVAFTDNFAHTELGQLFGQRVFLVEQAALQHGFVLQKAGHDFVEVFFANAGGFWALRRDQPFNFEVKLAGGGVHPDVTPPCFVAVLAVIKAVFLSRILGGEFITRCQHQLHQQAGGNGLEHVVDRLGHGRLFGGGLGNQVGEAGAFFTLGIAGGAAYDLHDFGQTAAVANGQRVFAPNPIEPLFGHAQRDDDVHVVAVVFLRGVFECGQHARTSGGIAVIHQIGHF